MPDIIIFPLVIISFAIFLVSLFTGFEEGWCSEAISVVITAGFIFILLFCWVICAMSQPWSYDKTEFFNIRTASDPDGTKFQYIDTPCYGQYNVTEKFHMIYPEGTQVQMKTRNRWAGGIYFMASGRGNKCDTYEYKVLLPE